MSMHWKHMPIIDCLYYIDSDYVYYPHNTK